MTTSRALVDSKHTDNSSPIVLDGSRRGAEKTAWTSCEALLQALVPWLEDRALIIGLDALEVVPIGSSEAVVVKVLYGDGDPVPLVGAALIERDIASAANRALLDAINRKLHLLASELIIEPTGSQPAAKKGTDE
jgi:hypothetical protein